MSSNAVDEKSLGAWLIKSSPGTSRADWLTTGFRDVTTRCVRPTYRTGIIAVDQPVLLWFSGQDSDHPAGIYAQGWTIGDASIAEDGQPAMRVALQPVEPPVLRHELLEHLVLSRIEVVRMPAGSNPSFLSKTQLAVLRREWPQVIVA